MQTNVRYFFRSMEQPGSNAQSVWHLEALNFKQVYYNVSANCFHLYLAVLQMLTADY